ncbi:pyridoxamine 5'-phosphate oxidase family protein [Ascidiimonas sp. W6]|uniref:pyridoxamine 5'-phosphate oxidase family protein n=1 Tax=Ascidiimonas meishanensis TaxID=3128903 RepID=UPI0030EB9674
MDLLFASIIKDFKGAVNHHKHAFRYFTLATVDEEQTPRLRTVVLREVDELLSMTVYTDRRSEKMNHIEDNKSVSMLFFDKSRLLQITVKATAKRITNDRELHDIWEKIPPKSRKDYTTESSPGQEIKNPDEVDYMDREHFFTAIRLIPEEIEYLRLKRPNHIRVRFKKKNENWKGTYLVP